MRASGRGTLFHVYLGVMLGVTVGLPVGRALILWGAEGAPWLAETVPGGGASLILAAIPLIWILAAAVGPHFAPARDTLPRLDLVHALPHPRDRLLRGGAARSIAMSAVLGGAGGVMVAGTFEVGAASAFASGLVLLATGLASGLGVGAGAGVAALIGQRDRASRMRVSLVCAVCVCAVCAGALAAAVLGESLPGFAPSRPSTVVAVGVSVLAGAGALSLGAVPGLLKSLDIDTLRSQAMRRLSVGAALLTADARAALARLGAPVRWGRRLRWRPSAGGRAGVLRLVVVRDALGLARTPLRTLLAVAALVLSGALAALSGAPHVEPTGIAVLGACSALLASAAAGTTARGLRAAAFGAGSPSLLPCSHGRLLVAHLVVPLVVSTLGALLGGVAVHDLGGGVLGVCIASGAALAAAVAAHQGPLPEALLAPVQTPAGDAAGLVVVIWMLGPLLTAAAGGALLAVVSALATASTHGAGFAVTSMTTALMLIGWAWWLRHRVRGGRG